MTRRAPPTPEPEAPNSADESFLFWQLLCHWKRLVLYAYTRVCNRHRCSTLLWLDSPYWSSLSCPGPTASYPFSLALRVGSARLRLSSALSSIDITRHLAAPPCYGVSTYLPHRSNTGFSVGNHDDLLGSFAAALATVSSSLLQVLGKCTQFTRVKIQTLRITKYSLFFSSWASLAYIVWKLWINLQTWQKYYSYRYCYFMFFFINQNFFCKSVFYLIYSNAAQFDFSQGGRGPYQFLSCFWQGGRGAGKFLIFADKGGRGVWNPQFLADMICEQPLNRPVLQTPMLFSY